MSEQEAGRDQLEIDNMFLCGSKFTRVSFKDSFFGDAHLMQARFEDVNGSGLVFDNANLSGAAFHNVNMSNVTIEAATLEGLSIKHANLTGMTINDVLVSDLFAAYEAMQKDG